MDWLCQVDGMVLCLCDLHCFFLYEQLATAIFSVTALDASGQLAVLRASFPLILVDEMLSTSPGVICYAVSHCYSGSGWQVL